MPAEPPLIVTQPFAWALSLIDATAKGSLVILAVALLVLLLRSRGAASTRHALWFGALLAIPLIPLATNLLPPLRVPLLPELIGTRPLVEFDSDAQPPPEAAPPPSMEELARIEEPQETAEPQPAAGETEIPASYDATSEQPFQTFDPMEKSTRRYEAERGWGDLIAFGNPHWSFWIFAVWLGGLLLVLARLAVGSLCSYWMVLTAKQVSSGELVEAVDALRAELRISRRVRLRLSGVLSLPKSGGILWPVVLLPAAAEDWDAEKARLVLHHELAHIKRWDVLTLIAGRLASTLQWFNPLVWLAHRRMREEMEQACDDAVLAAPCKPSEYAFHLATLAKSSEARSQAWAAVAMAQHSSLKSRIRSILDAGTNRRSAGRTRPAFALVAVLLALPLAVFQPWAAGESPLLKDVSTQGEASSNALAPQALEFVENAYDEGDDDQREAALMLLGRARETGAQDLLGRALGEGSDPVRRAAAWALGRLGTGDVVQQLGRALDDADQAVRLQAFQGLSKLGVRSAGCEIKEALYSEDAVLRAQAAGYLGESRDAWYVCDLDDALNDEEAAVRILASKSLGRIGGDDAIEALARGLEDEDVNVRVAALRALGEIGTQAAVNLITSKLNDEISSVRLAATQQLARVGGDMAVPGLITAAQTGNSEIRNRAITALGRIGTEAAAKGLAAAMRDVNSDNRRAAIEGLGDSYAEVADKALISAATADQDAENRRLALQRLREKDPDPASNGFTAALKDDHVSIRRDAILALGELDPDHAIPGLIHAATADKNSGNRELAMTILADFGDPRAYPAYAVALRGDNSAIKKIAISALVSIETEEAVGLLNATLVESFTFRPLDTEGQMMIVRALARIGNRESLKALQFTQQRSGNTEIRRAAAESLAQLRKKF